MKHKEYFSDTYEESRKKFLDATKKYKVESIKIQENLYIDFASPKKKTKKKLLILVSGTHGVETYLGSAAQQIFLKEYAQKLKNTDVCLIHSLNPYGFKHNRRVNENNVDLNRNSVYDERLVLGIPNTKIANIWTDSLLFIKLNRPRKHRLIEQLRYYWLVLKSLRQDGLKNTINLSVRGQSTFPHSIAYRGVKLEDSLLHLRDFIEEETKGYEEALLIDLHSGIGIKYEVLGFTNQHPHTPEYELLKKILRRTKSRRTIPLIEYIGSVSDLFLARSRANKNIDLTIEYGTIPKISSKLVLEYLGRLNIAENQIFYFGTEKQKQKIRKKYRKAYAPNDAVFKKSLIRKTRRFYDKIIKEYDE